MMNRMMMLMLLLTPIMVFGARTVENYNDGWEFSRDRKEWRSVTLPHDWAIAGPFDVKASPHTGKLPWQGRGYYRKRLPLAERPRGRMFLAFDGVMARSVVKVNGQSVGRGLYGYLGFSADITPYVVAGTNTVEVDVDTLDWASRWYPGAGIYRNVRLVSTDRVYLPEEDLFITTPEVASDRARVKVAGVIRNRGRRAESGEVTVVIRDREEKVVARNSAKVSAAEFADGAFAVELPVASPKLWRMEPNAYLYSVRVSFRGENSLDVLTKRIGIRSFRFDKDEGFFLNGENIRLQGVDLHSDLGPVGMAFNRSLMKRQLSIMREMGANALRTSHNPPAPEVLDLCDEMGIFVWDEAFDKWNGTCGRADIPLEEFVSDRLAEFVRRDRNHPCVFVWSIGNEITPGKATPAGQEHWAGAPALGTSVERCSLFRNVVRRFDTTRPVGIGSCFPEAGERGDYDALDITGWNYRGMYDVMKRHAPDKPLLYSESASAFSDYGYYGKVLPTNKVDYAKADRSVDSRDLNSAEWSDIADVEFERMEKDRFVGGEFVWTGIDYLGEPSPYAWPDSLSDASSTARSSFFGICDLMGFPKDRYYLYRSHWNRKDFTLWISPDHWNFEAGETVPVFVYASGAEEVELFVNGKSQGRRRLDPGASFTNSYYDVMKRYRYIWSDVVFAPGEITAIAYDKSGRELGSRTLHTAGAAARVVLEPEVRTLPELDETEMPFMAFVKVTLADRNGVPVPSDNRRVGFAAEGPLEIVAVGNSDPFGLDSFKETSSHPLKNGRAAVVVRRTGPGKATLRATAKGLEPAAVTFD